MNDFRDLKDYGYLNEKDYKRAQWAWEQSHPASKFMKWLKVAGHVSFAADNIRVSGTIEPSIPIPATKLAWEEITKLADEIYSQFGDLDPAISDQYGAGMVQTLAKEVQTATYRWPFEEKPHRVNAISCPGCDMLTLIYRPPRERGDGVLVDCIAGCGEEMSGDVFADLLDLIEQETMGTKKLANRWVVVEDAAELTGKSKDTIWRWARDGKVRVQHYSGAKYYKVADIYIAEKETRMRA